MPRRALITGLGLMGGSLAAALARAGWTLLLHHRRPEVAERAAAAGYGRVANDPLAAMRDVEIAVVCTPVSAIAEAVRRLAAAPGEALITDVGSTKARLSHELAPLAHRYLGSHPMAGSHRQGFDHADPDLYRGRVCVVTPSAATPAPALALIEELWRDAGSRVLRLEPSAHDRAVAEASHLPHILAACTAAGLSELGAPLAAGGFRDTTRIAAGSAELWRDILLDNHGPVGAVLDAALARLDALRRALAERDAEAVRAWLEAGCSGRRRFEARSPPSG